MIIRLLPLESLLSVARISRDFRLEAEACIYKSIKIDWEVEMSSTRFLGLQNALLAEPRRRALVQKIDFPTNLFFGPEALYVLLPILPHLKTMSIPSLDLPKWKGRDATFISRLPSRLEGVRIRAMKPSAQRLLDFYDSQPTIRTLHLEHFERDTIPPHLLPKLEELGGSDEVISQYVPGRPVKKVHHFVFGFPAAFIDVSLEFLGRFDHVCRAGRAQGHSDPRAPPLHRLDHASPTGTLGCLS